MPLSAAEILTELKLGHQISMSSLPEIERPGQAPYVGLLAALVDDHNRIGATAAEEIIITANFLLAACGSPTEAKRDDPKAVSRLMGRQSLAALKLLTR